MIQRNEVESLEDFVLWHLEKHSAIWGLDKESFRQVAYGYISRCSEENPDWHLFIINYGLDGKVFSAGDYPLRITEIENLLTIFTLFSNRKRKLIVNTKGYFY